MQAQDRPCDKTIALAAKNGDNQTMPSAPSTPPKPDKKDRLSKALRANLQRRKVGVAAQRDGKEPSGEGSCRPSS